MVSMINEAIKDYINKKTNFEFDIELSALTLENFENIDSIFRKNNLLSKMTYEIIDNTYIKIGCR